MNENKVVEKIVNSYTEEENTKLDELKALDSKVKKPALIFAYVFGSISALLLGFGMCVAMQVILADLMWLGIVVGVVGIAFCLLTYPIYKRILNSRKNKYREQILSISNELAN